MELSSSASGVSTSETASTKKPNTTKSHTQGPEVESSNPTRGRSQQPSNPARDRLQKIISKRGRGRGRSTRKSISATDDATSEESPVGGKSKTYGQKGALQKKKIRLESGSNAGEGEPTPKLMNDAEVDASALAANDEDFAIFLEDAVSEVSNDYGLKRETVDVSESCDSTQISLSIPASDSALDLVREMTSNNSLPATPITPLPSTPSCVQSGVASPSSHPSTPIHYSSCLPPSPVRHISNQTSFSSPIRVKPPKSGESDSTLQAPPCKELTSSQVCS